ncbi:hypothetical protein AB670_03064 [Chryseobacterium sp. MOF25P]|uniref:hypothetical protein n=1 Tax=unclassified Chryseobacterium TaxID=2593645 RepID=UPI0008057191|nr:MULTISPECIES: hypothetical protein [unclassified Chryseobacterium]OBW40600.1 hypothetical protein AB670_03064 [Chryseobacterium sp. MOF25P]OBW44733.1 hypothetical protein AB671_03174 [Chryseobacterium sp. BGARF1]
MKLYCILLFLLMLINCNKEPKVFEFTTETVDKNIAKELELIKNQKPYGLVFQDEKYEVWNNCSGEWGGTIYFKNKHNGKIRYAQSTCAVSVNKIGDKYYISNASTHLYEKSSILEIINPEKMELTLRLPPFHPEIETREYETKSNLGTKTIVDSVGVSILTSFVYKNNLYSILKNYKNDIITISKVENTKFKTVQTLDGLILNGSPQILKESENHQKLYFQHPKSGILDVKDNKIKFTFYKKQLKI